ncbi:MAG: hypothetical protein R3Y29_05380 [bacterium]
MNPQEPKIGILIYDKSHHDLNNNSLFAKTIIDNAKKQNLDIKLVFTKDLKLIINNNNFSLEIDNIEINNIKFAINRTKNYYISNHIEKMGIRVFNYAHVTNICNNKALTHQAINSFDKFSVKSIATYIENKDSFCINKYQYNYPYVVKSLAGHGGTEVYKADNPNELSKIATEFKDYSFLIQQLSSNSGKDVRAYIIGNQIHTTILRTNDVSFKSNFSLGGEANIYHLQPHEKDLINKILEYTHFDFVGIDFILDENNNFLFNEIEDVAGCRMLYSNDVDIIPSFISHIKTTLNK